MCEKQDVQLASLQEAKICLLLFGAATAAYSTAVMYPIRRLRIAIVKLAQ